MQQDSFLQSNQMMDSDVEYRSKSPTTINPLCTSESGYFFNIPTQGEFPTQLPLQAASKPTETANLGGRAKW
jgi:hypothetical protein